MSLFNKKNKSASSAIKVPSPIKRDILFFFILAVAVFSILAMFGLAGKAGTWVDRIWQLTFGWGWWAWPLMLLALCYWIINKKRLEIKSFRWVGILLFVLAYSGILHLLVGGNEPLNIASQGMGGGYLGYLVSTPIKSLAGFWGGLIIILTLLITSLLLISERSIIEWLENWQWPSWAWFKNLRTKQKERAENLAAVEDDLVEETVGFEQKEIPVREFTFNGENQEFGAEKIQPNMFPTQKKKFPKIDLPLELLNGKSGQPTAGDIKANQETIRKTLQYFGVEVEMGEISVGPTITQYTFKPASGVKVAQITTLANDLALALAAHPIRIEAPIPGKSLVGIEVPNQKIALVSLKEILASTEMKERTSNLMVALGKDVGGKPWLYDLARMPHLLIAGATGSGKTVCLNSVIISLLYQNQPDELKFIMVDPKRVELPAYNNIPHLVCPVITDTKKTINALYWCVKEMERRFQVLSNANKKNIATYNAANPPEKLPYLVLVIDELAELMVVSASEVEAAIIRLSQMARAVGIHLILATQRPSVDVITGLIKANITSRIAFSVASVMDSRTILDMSGAEKLLGRGDMLFTTPELSKPRRIQGAYVSDEEIDRVVGFIKQKGAPDYDDTVTEKHGGFYDTSSSESGFGNSFSESDELLEEAKQIIVEADKASASYLQRRLRIGYSRAARILDLLEEQGVVGPADGSRPREVLFNKEDLAADKYLEQNDLNNLDNENNDSAENFIADVEEDKE
ncbi:MAG TPA: DNA translocase FtsK 4TM domain-containing protein [bacterium]|nr:DNA translocase FtsK 4TM domain-containing protein [bacterium]